MKRNKFILAVAVLAFCILTSCSKHTQVSSTQKTLSKDLLHPHRIKVGFSIDTLAMERWQRDVDVFMNKAGELGAEVIVQNAGNKIDEQIRQIYYLAEKDVDVVVIVPKEAEQFTSAVQSLKAKNIPVVSYDRLLRNCPVDLYITVDCYEVGRLMANGMINVTDKRNWYCILGAKEDFNMTMLTTGLRQATTGFGINIDGIFYSENWNYDLSYQHMQNLLASKYIPEVILCGNDAIAASVMQAIREYGVNYHIPICGQDADIAGCQNVLSGNQDFTIYKPITELAATAAELAVELAKTKDASSLNGVTETINNGEVEVPVFWLKPALVDKNNLEDIIINSGFHSRSEIYQ